MELQPMSSNPTYRPIADSSQTQNKKRFSWIYGLQGVIGLSLGITGAVVKHSNRFLGGSLIGGGLVLAADPGIKYNLDHLNSRQSSTCIRLNKIACSILGTAFNAALSAYAFSLPENLIDQATFLLMFGMFTGVAIANAANLYECLKNQRAQVN